VVVRTETYDNCGHADPDELLTTGEAATILNSSRQHVVDLCERGDLPFTTIGTHRRVRRGDVDAIRDRTQRLTRDQRRSLWLAYAVAGRVVSDPDAARELALDNLRRMRASSRGQARRWLDEWEHLLLGPVDRLLVALVSRSPRSRELRQSSPFAGMLTDDERLRVLHAWQTVEAAEAQ
jgi:excisionase family DNA binding protein